MALNVCAETGLLPSSTCQTVSRVFIQRPDGSSGTTDDSNYEVPTQTCAGHRDLSLIEQLENLIYETESESETETEPPTLDSEMRRAEEDGEIPIFTEEDLILE